jgi:hypothetical protein
MLIQRANTILVYGETGTFKTSNIGRFARYMYEKTGKPTRLVSADGGGWMPVQAEIDAGIIDALRIVESEQPLPLLRKLGQGYWPVDGKLQLADLSSIGAYAVEGLTSIPMLLLRHLVKTGRKVSEEVIGKFEEEIEVDGKKVKESFSAPSRSHYGFIQNFVLDMLASFRALPVERVLFTAHEGKGSDDITNQMVYGPATVGKAITDRLPSEVGDLIHFYAVPVGSANTAKRLEVRCYMDKHPDTQTQILWPAKTRLQPEQLSEFNAKWPDKYFPLTLDQGIEMYLRFQDEARTKATAVEWKASIDQARSNAETSKAEEVQRV